MQRADLQGTFAKRRRLG